MPEVELRKDPLGANRGRSFLEQAGVISGVLSSQVRKKYHDKYYTPPYRPTNRHWEMTFASLGFNRRTIEKFWRLFCQINNCTDTIRLEHFLEHFDLDWTPWSERCFKNFDTKGSGEIDFLEFMITVWNICTFKIDSLSNFTFDMYDLDSDGELSLPEIERMVEELYGTGGGKQCLKEAIEFAEARGGALNL
jgi:Ca2+-binding EF-hand superfamily protein